MTASRAISLAALTVLDLPPWQQVRVAAAAGYSHVGLRLIPATPGEAHVPLLADPSALAATRTALAETGVGVLDVEILRLTPETDVAALEPVLALAGELGARFALVAGNDPDRERTADRLAALCALAEPYGIVPHLEFMPWTDVPTLACALAVCERAGRDAGVLIDAFHLDRSGGRIADVAAAGTDRFGYVQLCDIAGPVPDGMDAIIAEARAERLYPGEGEVDLAGLLALLHPALPISLEVPSATRRRNGMSARDHAAHALRACTAVIASAADRLAGA